MAAAAGGQYPSSTPNMRRGGLRGEQLAKAPAVYRLLRRSVAFELAIVALAAVLVSYPLRSELWWPSCALLMLVAILVPWQRVVAYCVLVLLANLAAHAIAGDLTTTPVVTIVGLWVGFPFWSLTFSVISDRFAAYVLRLQWTLARSAQVANEPVRVTAWTDVDRRGDAAEDVDPTPADPPAVDGAGVRTAHELVLVAAAVAEGLAPCGARPSVDGSEPSHHCRTFRTARSSG